MPMVRDAAEAPVTPGPHYQRGIELHNMIERCQLKAPGHPGGLAYALHRMAGVVVIFIPVTSP